MTCKIWIVFVLSVLGLFAAITMLGLSDGSTGNGSIRGARFGMSREQTRLHFRDSTRGWWRAGSTTEYELLIWNHDPAQTGNPRRAIFVFHQGLLTAARLVLDAETAREQAVASPATDLFTLAIEPGATGVVLTYTLRWCNLSQNSGAEASLRWEQIMHSHEEEAGTSESRSRY